jgi:hypothetical protein
MLARNTILHAPAITCVRPRAQVSIWCVILLVIAVAFFFLPVAAKAKTQLFLAPVVIILVSRIRCLGISANPVITALAVVGAVSGFVWQFYHVSLASGAFVVSTVSDQELRQESKIYRDRLRKSIGPEGSSLVGLYSYTVNDQSGARRIIDVGGKVSGVIWGSPRWIRVALKSYEPLALHSFPEGSLARAILDNGRWPDLFISRTVTEFGISDGYATSSVFFIAQIAQIWGKIPEIMNVNADSDRYAGLMEALGRMQARWTSRTHLAVPLWLAGTMSLVRGIESSAGSVGDLECAIRNLRVALNLVTARENQVLDMSIRNNLAIALLAQAELGIDAESARNAAARNLNVAYLGRGANVTVGNSVAQNLYAISAKRTRKRR